MSKNRVPAIEGWFTLNEDPQLIGLRDAESGTYFFPKDVAVSRAPGYDHVDLEEVELSRTGKLWSYTTNHYQPPAPYVSPEPFKPYTIAAVELEREKMVVLGQIASDVDPEELKTGDEVELVLETLYEDDDSEFVVWKWKPIAAEGRV